MLPILLIVIGIIICFVNSFSLSSSSEIRRPKTITLGIITIVSGILATLIGNLTASKNQYTQTDVFVYVAAYLIPIISLAFLKQPKLQSSPLPQKTSNKVINIIGWLVLLAVVVFLLVLMVKSK